MFEFAITLFVAISVVTFAFFTFKIVQEHAQKKAEKRIKRLEFRAKNPWLFEERTIDINTDYVLTTDLPAGSEEIDGEGKVYRCFITKTRGNWSFNLATTGGNVFLRVTGISEMNLLFLMFTYNRGYFCEFLTDEQLKSYVEYVVGRKTYEEHIRSAA